MINFYEHIDAFMEDSLDPSVRSQMEEAINNDSDLQAAIADYPAAKKLSEAFLELDILETIQSLENEQDVENEARDSKSKIIKSTQNKSYVKWIGLLALLSLVIFSYKYLVKGTINQDQQELFVTLYTPPVNKNAVRSTNLDLMHPLDAGKHLFFLNSFDQSLAALQEAQKLTTNKDSISQINYWLGHVHLNKMELSTAKEFFEKSMDPDKQTYLDLINKLEEK